MLTGGMSILLPAAAAAVVGLTTMLLSAASMSLSSRSWIASSFESSSRVDCEYGNVFLSCEQFRVSGFGVCRFRFRFSRCCCSSDVAGASP